ncbi:MAG TPA: hemin uptake protein HemP [Tepidisphaeraceae bacterium]|nr:hemin uptake protein HemP [Tepidisphaeraceae bacterium]
MGSGRDRRAAAGGDAVGDVAPGGSGSAGGKLPTIDVRRLLADHKEARLIHDGQEYRLRITRQGKLILTK